VARGEKTVQSLTSRVEQAFTGGKADHAVRLLAIAPGMLVRSVDRVLRAASPHEAGLLCATVRETAGRVSGRALLSLREHLDNRGASATPRGPSWAARAARAAPGSRPTSGRRSNPAWSTT
jgi:hypothetical protein